MKKALRWRYYCEHCRKVGGSAHHMAKHELGCTANPSRVCSMHHYLDEDQPKLADLIAIARDGLHFECAYNHRDDNKSIAKRNAARLREASHGCPACIFAAIRQSKVDEALYFDSFEFDMKAECAKFWENIPRDQEGQFIRKKSGLDIYRAAHWVVKQATVAGRAL